MRDTASSQTLPLFAEIQISPEPINGFFVPVLLALSLSSQTINVLVLHLNYLLQLINLPFAFLQILEE